MQNWHFYAYRAVRGIDYLCKLTSMVSPTRTRAYILGADEKM